MRLTVAVEHFLASLEARSYSPRSVSTRRWFLKEFIGYCRKRGVEDAREVTGDFLRSYLLHLRESAAPRIGRGYSESTVGGFAVTLSVFFEYLARRGEILFDISRSLPVSRRTAPPGAFLTAIQAERILALPDVSRAEGLRDRAILETLYSTAIRRAELAALHISDVRFESGTILVRQGKFRKDRIVPVGERALRWIGRYISAARPALLSRGRADERILFLSSRGQNITPQSVTKITALYVRRSGLAKGSCHIFRHTCATEMLSNGADIIHVQEMLGHANVQTSQLYTHISPGLLKEKYTRTHPAAFAQIEEGEMHAPARRSVAKYVYSGPPRGKREFVIRNDLDRAILSYLEHRRIELADASISAFGHALTRFAERCSEWGVVRVRDITLSVLEAYQSSLTKRTKVRGGVISIKTQKLEMEVVSSFVRFCHGRGLLLCDPSARIVIPRVGATLVAEILTREEVGRVLSLPDTDCAYGLRDRAMLEILYASGVRSSEFLRLRMTDADFERDALRVQASKLGQDRVIPIGGRAMKWLHRYVHDARDEFVRDGDPGTLFLSNQGRRMAGGTLGGNCRKYLTLAGIRKREAVHIFRHTCAAHMIENGADLRTVQEFLGHRSANSTLIYAHLSIRKLKEVHAKTHPAERRFLERMRMTEEELAEAKAGDAETEVKEADR